MKADVKAQWVKDLRSGEFEQGVGRLERVDTAGTHYVCCLGVLCRQAVKAGVIPEPELHAGKYYYLDDRLDDDGRVAGEAFNQSSCLPRKVQEWAGLKGEDVSLGVALTAIGANDGAGMPFAQIADLIEQNVPAE